MFFTTTIALSALLTSAAGDASPAADAPADGRREKIRVVVLDLRADGVDPSLAASITGVVGSELDDTGVLQVTTEDDVRRLMDLEQMKLMLACTDAVSPSTGSSPEAKCLTSFKDALGAKYLVTGSVGKAGDQVLLSLMLLDVDKAISVGRESAQVRSASGLVSAVRGALPRLLKPILEERAGALAALSNEEGATVYIDGAAVGVSPWRVEQLAAGPHRIEASKEGFIKSGVDVVVPPGEQLAVQILLLPSQEFADNHRRTAWAWRIGGISTAAGAALALGTGASVWVYQSQRTGEFAKDAALDNTGAILLPAAKYNELQFLRATSYVLMGATVPLAIASGTLFFLGDDPAKYDSLIPAAPAPTAE